MASGHFLAREVAGRPDALARLARRSEKELAAATARLVLLSRAEERVAAVSAEAEADFARKRDENRELSAKLVESDSRANDAQVFF